MYCRKLKREATPLPFAPLPGALGERIMNEISKEAWELWVEEQTRQINEHRFNLADSEDRLRLRKMMHLFLFEEELS